MTQAKTVDRTQHGDTREQIVRIARKLIQTRSYLGFSFQDIANSVGVRKASLYHHFPTKEALGVEVLHEAIQAFEEWTRSGTRSSRQWLEAYFLMYRNAMRAGEQVCPGGALVGGWDSIDEELRQAVRDLRDIQVSWLAGILKDIGVGGKQAAALASFIYANCQGALVTARMTGRVEDFDELITHLKKTLKF